MCLGLYLTIGNNLNHLLSSISLPNFGYFFRFGQIRAVEIDVNIKFNVPSINIQKNTEVLFGIFLKLKSKMINI